MPYPTKGLQEYLLKSDFDVFAVTVGIAGPPGPPGPPGTNGTNGTSGINGTNGVDGANGINWLPAQSATSPVLVSGDIITTNGVTASRVSPAANVTGVILAIGTVPAQQLVVLNEGAGAITMAAAGTSHVSLGSSSVIPALTHVQFVWSSGTNLWYPASGYGTPIAPIPATAYSLTGPTSGLVGVPSAPFTVQVSPSGSSLGSVVTVTPSVTGGGTYGATTYGDGTYSGSVGVAGTFSPTSVTFTAGLANASATFTFTPSASGTAVISVTNSGGLPDPASISYSVSSGTGSAYGSGAYGAGPFGG